MSNTQTFEAFVEEKTKKLTVIVDNKFNSEQLKMIEEGVLGAIVLKGTSYYKEDTLLTLVANETGHLIDKVDIIDKCLRINDGDNDIGCFNWRTGTGFRELVVLDPDAFKDTLKFEYGLATCDANTLEGLVKTYNSNVKDLRSQLEAINKELDKAVGITNVLREKVKEKFELE